MCDGRLVEGVGTAGGAPLRLWLRLRLWSRAPLSNGTELNCCAGGTSGSEGDRWCEVNDRIAAVAAQLRGSRFGVLGGAPPQGCRWTRRSASQARRRSSASYLRCVLSRAAHRLGVGVKKWTLADGLPKGSVTEALVPTSSTPPSNGAGRPLAHARLYSQKALPPSATPTALNTTNVRAR